MMVPSTSNKKPSNVWLSRGPVKEPVLGLVAMVVIQGLSIERTYFRGLTVEVMVNKIPASAPANAKWSASEMTATRKLCPSRTRV